MGKLKKVDVYDLNIPDMWEPEWFRMSPTMKLIKGGCGYAALLKYILGISPRKENMSLLRGRVVHRLIQLWLLARAGLQGYEEWDRTPIKQGVNRLLREYVEEPDGDLYKAIAAKYDWPKPFDKRKYFTLTEFIEQLFMHTYLLQQYVVRSGIIIANVQKRPLVEESIQFPIISRSGEIIEKANGEPLMAKNVIDLAALDDEHDEQPVLIDWKIGMKRYTVSKEKGLSDMDTNFALISYAGAMAYAYSDFITWPVKTRIVHTVVNKKGEVSKTASWNCNGEDVMGIEVFDREVTEDEFKDLMDEYIIDANDMRNVNLTKNRGMNCLGMCNYSKLCLKGDTTDCVQTKYEDEE